MKSTINETAAAAHVFGPTEQAYRARLLESIHGVLEHPTVSTGTLAFIAEAFCSWETNTHEFSIEEFVQRMGK